MIQTKRLEIKGIRGIFLSDAHMYESEDPLKKELSGKKTTGENMITKAIKEGERRFILTLKKAQTINADFVFCGGDMVTGYGERGLIGPNSQEHIDKFKEAMEEHFPSLPIFYMAGGHELGYILPLSTDPEGGPSEESIAAFEKNFGPLFYTFHKGPYKFVVLSSDLILLQHGSENLLTKKRLQTEFYQDEVAYSDHPIVLMIHDPDALALMFPFLKKHLYKIAKTFAGHQHAQWVKKIYPWICKTASSPILEIPLKSLLNKLFPGKANAVWSYFQNNKENAEVWKKLSLSIIPAPGGMMGIGGGFLFSDFRNKGVEVQKIKIL